MWWLDLDELETLSKSNRFVSYNRFNLFSIYDKDHLLGETNSPPIKENIIKYIQSNGLSWDGGKIYLLTNLRTVGYLFNPVSIYFCFDKNGQPLCSIAEVGNTYYEMKAYLIKDFADGMFSLKIPKHFYVSPFANLDDEFHFQLQIPDQKLNIKIDDYRAGERFFISTLTGVKKELTSSTALLAFIRFPMMTLQVIFLIHWQALKLWMKKIPFHSKAANPDLQRDVQRKHKSLKENIS